MTEHQGLPVHGYRAQSDASVTMVNHNKRTEEQLLRLLDHASTMSEVDPRWLSIARTHFEQGFMALNRAIFRPERLKDLPDA